MPLAALYDIHGNLPALEAVLAEVRELDVDLLVVGGDVIVGPMSKECIELLLAAPIPTRFIKGNCETSVLATAMGNPETHLPEAVQEEIRWTAEQLESKHLEEIARWPTTISVDVDRIGKTLFCHATPRNEHEIFTKETSADKLAPIFQSLEEKIVVCGHTHMQFDRYVGASRVINAGSIGMPFGSPGAYWLYIDSQLELRKTAFDMQVASELIHKTSYPNAENFVRSSLLDPPTEEAMLALFHRSEIQ